MSERPKIYVKPNGSIRVTGAADFVDADGKVLETKDETHATRPTTSLPHRTFGKTNMKGDKYKDNYEQLDQIDEHARPYSAQVPHLS